jgi:hypothetical protein
MQIYDSYVPLAASNDELGVVGHIGDGLILGGLHHLRLLLPSDVSWWDVIKRFSQRQTL